MNKLDFDTPKFEGIELAADWIIDLESSDSRLHKESVIEKALMASLLGSASAQCFLFNCYQAYNPYYVFGVKQVPETTGLEHRPNKWPVFWALCEALRTRGLTGHAARDRILAVSTDFDSLEWNSVCRRVLIKDLRCGISEKTLNKVLGKTEWKIPVFGCQLATDSDKHVAKLKGRKRIEQKLDGVRVLAVVTPICATLYSRNGKEFENFPEIAAEIFYNRSVFNINSTSFVLDGEIMGESFQALMKQAQRKNDVKTTDMVYHIFDIIPLADFEAGLWNKNQQARLTILEEARNQVREISNLTITTGIEVDLDTAEGHDVMRRYANDAVTAGFEGIMIKDLAAPYECKRSSFWMKWKPVITVDLTIVGFEEGTGRNAGRLGALICEGVDDGRKIRVNVGSGLSDSNRDEYWNHRDSLNGNLVEVEADAVTQNQDGSYSLRFPVFVRFRSFEPGEKL
jgi:DNA ligase-1